MSTISGSCHSATSPVYHITSLPPRWPKPWPLPGWLLRQLGWLTRRISLWAAYDQTVHSTAVLTPSPSYSGSLVSKFPWRTNTLAPFASAAGSADAFTVSDQIFKTKYMKIEGPYTPSEQLHFPVHTMNYKGPLQYEPVNEPPMLRHLSVSELEKFK